MKKAKDLFDAVATSLYEMVMAEDGRVGFLIPEYQRQYDWSKDNILRFYYDALNGFSRVPESKDANAFTFLGTLILVKQESKEEDFSGPSFAIVDGQQRLTTLALFACALSEALRRHLDQVEFPSSIKESVRTWLKAEVKDILYALYECAVGSQRVSPRNAFPFPRIVRHNDSRGRSEHTSEYRSAIARFLDGFAYYFGGDQIEYINLKFEKGTDADVKRLYSNYQVARHLIKKLNDLEWYEDTECEQFDISKIAQGSCRNLFGKLPDYIKNEDERNRALSMIVNHDEIHALTRTLLFASYFCNCIVLTRVRTNEESAAFDIFDALNTTGEPLTALETLKPRVISYENNNNRRSGRGYAGTPSESAFNMINQNLDQRFLDTSKKQAETKDLIVMFALYLEGKKLSKELAAQRNFLRQSYDNATGSGVDSAHQFVKALADITRFRRYYWEHDGIEKLGGEFHRRETVDEVQLISSFIADTKTSLALPIISRYWTDELRCSGESRFIEVLKAVAAFLILRRAATGGTAGIDSDLRAVMAPSVGRGSSRKFALCAGVDHSNDLLPSEELKAAFRTLLEYKLKNLSKEAWIGMATANPLYLQSKELVRFMILTAGHQAVPSEETPGTWNKTGIRASAHTNNFLSYGTWHSNHYATVEHIAPATESQSGWDDGLYKDNILRHTLGNLVLLPVKENSAIGNESWQKKKKFYLALTEASDSDQKRCIEEARDEGITFSDRIIETLKSGPRLSLLDPLRSVNKWDAELVVARGKNIAELCWDHVWPWLN